MGLLDDISKEAGEYFEAAKGAIMDAADAFSDGYEDRKGTKKLFLMKNELNWKEQFMFMDDKKNVVYIGKPVKWTRTKELHIITRSNNPAADIVFNKKKIFADGITATVHICEPEYSFDIDMAEKGLMFGAGDFSIISVKKDEIIVKDGEKDACEIYKRRGSFEASYSELKYEYLAAALIACMYVNKELR